MAGDRGSRWRELVSLGLVVAASIAVDPVQRRNCRLAAERALRSARDTLNGPPPPTPAPWEVTALHDEARRITREAADREQ